jgi:hypothetical protein
MLKLHCEWMLSQYHTGRLLESLQGRLETDAKPSDS